MENNDYLKEVVANQANVEQELHGWRQGAAPAPAKARRLRKGIVEFKKGIKGVEDDDDVECEEAPVGASPVDYRITGWFFKTVVVPPNAYVVHTRRGHAEPLHLGLGVSFRYNPYTDAYLVVPAAMQTIGIVANCISQEKQGLNILAYVQWQINDFSVAYRKLDFSDSRDPLGIVNAQLREQAEAAIKDKIATMSVQEVLTDKEPIIEELTTRLKAVAEGRSQGNGDPSADEGLGIKIVTVQLKEAIVSSQRLWEHLQAPFRYEQEKTARISYLLVQDEIRQKALDNRQTAETSEAETLVAIERIKQSKQTEALDIRLTEEATRFSQEQESARQRLQLEEQTTLTRRESDQRLQVQAAQVEQEQKLAALGRQQEESLEQTRLNSEASARRKALQVQQALQELTEEERLAEARLQATRQQFERDTDQKTIEAEFKQLVQQQEDALREQVLTTTLARQRQQKLVELELEEAANQTRLTAAEREVELDRLRQEVRNLINQSDLSAQLIDRLPALAAHMPDIQELKVLQTGDGNAAADALVGFLARLLTVGESLGLSLGDRNGQNGKVAAEPANE
jgi:regulator of protease activity HflC (stomatin/prohibitin superfamily)